MNHPNTLSFSPIIVGTMRLGQWGAQFSTNEYRAFIEDCISLGMTSFDHADIYGDYTTEAEFGAVLKTAPHLRDKLQLITKCGIRRVCEQRPSHRIKSYDSSSSHILKSVENSLSELNTDYLDMLLIHRPDYLMYPDEVAETISILLGSGKIRSFGCQTFPFPSLTY